MGVNLFFYFFIFIFGLAVGSFLNCVIYRLEKGENFLRGRSYCPHCKNALSWQDLVPLLSFVLLKGKCHYCRQKISWQYPIVEISTGLIFLLISSFQFPISNFLDFITFIYLLIISCFLIIIFAYDLKHFIIPDEVIYLVIGIAFFYQLFRILNFEFVSNFEFRISNFSSLVNPFLSAISASMFFLIIVLVSRGKWMGVGDIKLAFFMGLFLGFPNILTALFLAFSIGAIIGVGLIAAGKKNLKSEVPFGPFLVTGTFIALFWGERIINWYLNFI